MTDEIPPRKELEEDRGWLDAFRRGDRAALERVFRTYVGVVMVVATDGFVVGDGRRAPGLPPDARHGFVHDVFIKAFADSARQGYDGLRPYAPYLVQIARHALADHWRKATAQKRSAAFVDLDAIPAPASHEPLPDRVLIDAETDGRVRAFLGTLSPEEQRFVRLRFEQGQGQADVALALGVTRHRVRAWDEEIRTRFRKFLADG